MSLPSPSPEVPCGEGDSEASCDGGGGGCGVCSDESGEQEKNNPNHYLHLCHYHPLSLPPLQHPLWSPPPLCHHNHKYQTIITPTTTIKPIPLPPPSLPPSQNSSIALLQQSYEPIFQPFFPQSFIEGFFCGGLLIICVGIDVIMGMVVVAAVVYCGVEGCYFIVKCMLCNGCSGIGEVIVMIVMMV